MLKLIKIKDVQLQSCRKLKKNINETNKKSKSEGPVSMERSRSSQVTPDKRDVKTSRTRVSETSQKRKRGSLSNVRQRRRGARQARLLKAAARRQDEAFATRFSAPFSLEKAPCVSKVKKLQAEYNKKKIKAFDLQAKISDAAM